MEFHKGSAEVAQAAGCCRCGTIMFHCGLLGFLLFVFFSLRFKTLQEDNFTFDGSYNRIFVLMYSYRSTLK